jgi:DNA repair protein RadC
MRDQRLFQEALSLNGNKTIKNLPHLKRPREKALYYGIGSLSDVELLALLIGKGTSKDNALSLARKLLHKHISLHNLYRINDPKLLFMPGIGEVKALKILAAFELNKRLLFLEGTHDRPIYNEMEIVRTFQNRIGRLHKETLYLLALTKRNYIISEKQLYLGTEAGFNLDPKEVVRELLIANADRYILIHNHPSGHVEPSGDDLTTTIELAKISAQFGVTLYDHLIIGANAYFSLRKLGKL